MTLNATLDLFRAAFAPYRASLEAQGVAHLRGIFASAVEALGPSLRGVYNNPRFARVWSETMKYVTGRTGDRADSVAVLDEARLAKFVSDWAAAELEGAAEKLTAKVANLSDVEVLRASGSGAEWFVVYGKRPDGTVVKVEQNQIVNVSSKGKLFNQWPARIYVAGKFISEAAYKRLDAVAI
jgi:hypothetical protein